MPVRRMHSTANTAAAIPAFVARAAPVQPAALHFAPEWIARPSPARRNHVEVTVEVHRRL
jgi:hypothetical protein